jgi:flagellar motility protein MotE (MotC chaperone)
VRKSSTGGIKMAKSNANNENSGGTKGLGVLIIVLIIITWLSVMALLIKCDVGGFGSQVLRPVFKDIPVINAILPDASDEEVAKESDYPYDNLQEALVGVASRDDAISEKDALIVSLNETISEQNSELERLREYETEYNDLQDEKNAFYNEIVYGDSAPDTDTYVEWYNELDSEAAERIYSEIVQSNETSSKITDMAKTYEEMDASAAADILSSMSDDLDTVALIMNNMSTTTRGEVLAAMDPELAALITKKLLP